MVRTRVGYSGGTQSHPTYHNLGDHTETLQIDFDPLLISYQQLLVMFWANHNPTQRVWSRQYMAALFYHNDQQQALALQTKEHLTAEQKGKFFKAKIHTQILPANTFYLAEDYHQKYLLQQNPDLMAEFKAIYPHHADFVNSTAAARVNGYVGYYGQLVNLKTEVDSLGLSASGREILLAMGQRFKA